MILLFQDLCQTKWSTWLPFRPPVFQCQSLKAKYFRNVIILLLFYTSASSNLCGIPHQMLSMLSLLLKIQFKHL